MAKTKRNFRATLDVTADALPLIASLLPSGYHIAGSQTMHGVVRLVLEGASVDVDGKHLQMVVVNEANERRVTLQDAPNKPPRNTPDDDA